MDVVIVGHGKTPTGKGWGSNIDACDTVVRMWNHHWQNERDYGVKYDVGFFEISNPEMTRFNKHNCRFPTKGWVATVLHSNVGKKLYKGELPTGAEVVASGPWEAEGMRLGGVGLKGRLVLSRGARAAAWALGWLPRGHRLILVGFDNVYTQQALPVEEGFPPEYVECRAGFPFRDYPRVGDGRVGVTKYGNHDYAVEGPLLKSLAAKRDVVLSHAQDIW